MTALNGALPVEYPEASYLRDLAQRFESPEDANNLRAIASQIDWLNRELNAARKSISDSDAALALKAAEKWMIEADQARAYAMDVRRALEDCCTRMERCKGILRADRSAPQGWNVLDTTNARAALAKNPSTGVDRTRQGVAPAGDPDVSHPHPSASELTVACRWRSWCDEGKWLPPEKQCDECPRLHSHSSGTSR